jgi:3-oxoacyl-[acyl-carrier-protein] synthase-3
MNKSAHILGTGSYAPPGVIDNFDLEKMVDTSDEWIVGRTGIRERRFADGKAAASDVALEASRIALDTAGTTPEELDLIILGTVTPDYVFPATACVLQDLLGARDAAAFDLSAGCSGLLYGINIATQFVETGKYKKILCVGVETLSKILDMTDRNTCVLFGDGAGAVLLGESSGGPAILSTYMKSDGSLVDMLYMPGGGSRNPASHETIDARMHYIKMEGREVFKVAVRMMVEASEKVLNEAGFSGEDIDVLIPHQANMRIMEAVAKRLHVPREKVYVNLDKYGNTSAASIGLALDEAVRDGTIRSGHLVLLVAFGAGFTWAGTLVRWV